MSAGLDLKPWEGRICADKNLFRIDEPMVDRVQNEFQSIGDSQFVEYVRQVVFYGVLADAKFLRQIFVGIACANKRYDLLLPRSEAEVRAGGGRPRGRRHVAQSIDEIRNTLLTHPVLSFSHTTNALQEQIQR